MVDMRNDGGSANPSPADSNEESKSQRFTPVNNGNANGNGNSSVTVMTQRSQLPPIASAQPVRDGGGSNASASTLNSPRQGEEQWRQGGRAGSVETPGTSQKRKRSPEILSPQKRAMTPTTQITQHHLAAHEAAMAEEHPGNTNHTSQHRNQPSLGPEDNTGNYSVDEDVKGNDDGRTRAGTQEGSPQPGTAQGDPKKRKRIFSNRTKTGCITCRRRKKKCDEGKPECSNCKRGGFVCEGYSGKINWQKPPGKSGNTATTPVSIQSKTEQPESASASPTPVHVVNAIPKQLHHRPEEIRRISYQPAPVATIVIDETKPSLEDPVSPSSALRQQHPNVYSNEQPTQAPSHQPYTPVPQQPPSSLTPAPASVANHSTSVSMAAISAASGSALNRPRSEKEKMINSELYHASAPELIEERERCKAACWRFNNATNPNLGISKTERGRLLLDVLRPGRNWGVVTQQAAPGAPPQTVYVNDQGYHSDIVDVQVDAPFTCSYGYNIRLGEGVYIEFGCTILDSCAVTIKARTILSPNVRIYSATHPIDPRKRNGAQGPEVAKPVMIEEDCWLGGNVIVLGGITIGKGSVVGAGSVVTRDVPPFTVVAGNPARVIRGIYQNGIDM